MKTISANLNTHLQGETTTVATCWYVTRRDGQSFGFTSHDQDLVIDGVTYLSTEGYTPTSLNTTSNLDVDEGNVLGYLGGSVVTAEDLRAGVWDYSDVEIFLVNYASLGDGKLYLRKGSLGECRWGRTRFETELRGLGQKLTQRIGRVITPLCDADLGDLRCGINLAVFTDGTRTGSITGRTNNALFADATISQPVGWFDGGLLEWTSGLNDGYGMEVKSNTSGGVITLQQPMPRTVAIGDTYTMTAGCDKSAGTCQGKFANIINFRGFPFVPGMDKLIRGK